VNALARRLGLLLGLLWCCVVAPGAWSADRVRVVVAGSERGTNTLVVRDIAKYVARLADLEFDLRHAQGSADALFRLRDGGGLQFALLQADLADAFLGAAARGNIEAGQLLAPVRVLAPLHEEEIYFIVRSDSPMNFVHEIENARINLGPPRGDTALTVTTLYRLMFGTALPEAQANFDSHQNALVKLTEKTVDVVALVAPQAAKLLTDMTSDARRFVKLLKFDAKRPGTEKTLQVYSTKTIPASIYPNLLDEDLSALVVRVYLVSYGRNDVLQARFANAWCQNLPRLLTEGYPGLRSVDLAPQPLVKGWDYSRPFERELRACIEDKRPPAESCSPEERVLGLCG